MQAYNFGGHIPVSDRPKQIMGYFLADRPVHGQVELIHVPQIFTFVEREFPSFLRLMPPALAAQMEPDMVIHDSLNHDGAIDIFMAPDIGQQETEIIRGY
jgi:hypothetical protein